MSNHTAIPAIALLLRLSESTLNQALHFKASARLGYDALSYIAKIVGCSVNAFTGTPSESSTTVPQKELNEVTEGRETLCQYSIQPNERPHNPCRNENFLHRQRNESAIAKDEGSKQVLGNDGWHVLHYIFNRLCLKVMTFQS